jgi:hypothetical protein
VTQTTTLWTEGSDSSYGLTQRNTGSACHLAHLEVVKKKMIEQKIGFRASGVRSSITRMPSPGGVQHVTCCVSALTREKQESKRSAIFFSVFGWIQETFSRCDGVRSLLTGHQPAQLGLGVSAFGSDWFKCAVSVLRYAKLKPSELRLICSGV